MTAEVSRPATDRPGNERSGNERSTGRIPAPRIRSSAGKTGKSDPPAKAEVRPTRTRGRNERSDATEALVELHRAANAVRHHVEQAVLRQENLTWTGFVVLREVWAARKLETRHAAEQAGIAKATLTGVVDTLVRRGLVRRDRHPEDGRLVILELTRRGDRLIRQLLPTSRDEEEFALGYLDGDGITQVTTLLRQLVAHLDDDPARERRL